MSRRKLGWNKGENALARQGTQCWAPCTKYRYPLPLSVTASLSRMVAAPMVGDANGPCLVPCAPFSAPEVSCSHVQQHRQPGTPPSISLTCDTELEVNMLPNWHLKVSTWRQLQTEKSSIMSNIFLGNQPALSVVQAWKAGQGGHQEEPLSLLLYNLTSLTSQQSRNLVILQGYFLFHFLRYFINI